MKEGIRRKKNAEDNFLLLSRKATDSKVVAS